MLVLSLRELTMKWLSEYNQKVELLIRNTYYSVMHYTLKHRHKIRDPTKRDQNLERSRFTCYKLVTHNIFNLTRDSIKGNNHNVVITTFNNDFEFIPNKWDVFLDVKFCKDIKCCHKLCICFLYYYSMNISIKLK